MAGVAPGKHRRAPARRPRACLGWPLPYRPAVQIVLIAAQSLDGFITRHAEPGTAFTSSEDKAYFHTALAGFEAGIFGGETYRVSRDVIRTNRSGLRLRVVLTRSPEQFAADALPGALEFTTAEPAAIVADLTARGVRRCALLGGSQAHSRFLAAGLVDEVWLTIEPRLFGGGTPLLAGPTDIRLRLEAVERLGPHGLILKYRTTR